MASCNNCGALILFGGEQENQYRFCSKKCFEHGRFIVISDQLPENVIKEQITHTHQGPCPKCNKQNGPVDIHTGYRIWSAVVLTSWANKPQVSCRSCGIKNQSFSLISSILFGWWGLPWGIIMTPVQITRNIIGLIKSPNPNEPSKKLENLVKINLGRNIYAQQQENTNI